MPRSSIKTLKQVADEPETTEATVRVPIDFQEIKTGKAWIEDAFKAATGKDYKSQYVEGVLTFHRDIPEEPKE